LKKLQESVLNQIKDRKNELSVTLIMNDKNIVSSISVTDIVFDKYLGKRNYKPFQSENSKLFLN